MKIIHFCSLVLVLLYAEDYGIQRPLNILYVLDEFPKFNQPFVLNQIVGLIRVGHNVKILADHSRYPDMVPPEIAQYKLDNVTYYKELPSELRDFDIICTNFGQNGCWALALMNDGKISGKLVTIFQGADLTRLTKKHPKKQFYRLGGYEIKSYCPDMYNELFEKGSLFLGVCKHFKKKLISLGASPSKTGVHHNGIDCTKFQLKERSISTDKNINLISICRLTEKKGIEYAIRAFAQISPNYQQATYSIIGDGPLRADLEDLIKQLDMQERIQILGWKTQEMIIKLLKKAHIFILPSVTASSETDLGDQEGMPTVIMEAMAMGLPVLATYHSGIPEIVYDGVTGYLVPERDIEGLACKLSLLFEHADAWPTMGKRARKVILRKCNIERQAEKLCKLFYELLEH